ncbi:chitin disaccharide deacetylase [uncultured Cedecea sp.]|uniref:chitin disaccharide deacetylase n=1 Tax=uncultured Cedecea sp. TaxID=988762 RepID=UPI00262451E6|nr:chitin disaccharide deacetylase [uncultured Cedecea sp.]
MEPVLIVNADDFGLSKGQNYGIIEACHNGLVTSTTALVNGAAIRHAVELSRTLPTLGVGMHFVLTQGKPLSTMQGLTREGRLGKWLWQMAEQGCLPLDEIARELDCQYRYFIELFGREPTHIDSHHHVHMLASIYPVVAEFAREKGLPVRLDRRFIQQDALAQGVPRSSDAFSSDFYGDTVSEAQFLQILDAALLDNVSSLEVMCHPSFIDSIVMESTYCYPRLTELDILTSASLKQAVKSRGFRLGNYYSLESQL